MKKGASVLAALAFAAGLYCLAPVIPPPPSAGGGVWGAITGTLSAQTDLANELALKQTAAQVQALVDDEIGVTIQRGGYTSTPTAAGFVILTSASTHVQRATGVTAGRAYKLPSCGTLYEGYNFLFINDSSAPITVIASGGDSVIVTTLSAGSISIAACTSATTDEDDESAFWSSHLISPVSNAPYGVAWNASLLAPTQGELRTQIEAIIASIPAASGSALLSSTSVNLDSGGVSNLYVAPGSRNAIITNIVMHHFSADPTAARVTFGWDGPGLDLVGAEIRFDVVVADTTTAVILNRSPDGVTPPSLIPNPPIGTPSGELKIAVTAEGSALTCRVDVFGYLTQTTGAPP